MVKLVRSSTEMEAPSPSPSSSLSRTWRMAFLTLRDEVLTSPASTTVIPLLHRLIFSQRESLIAASIHLPPHEVTCDVMFLMELGRTLSSAYGADFDDIIIHTFTHLSFLIYQFCYHVTFEITSSFWALLLDLFGRMVEIFLSKSCLNRFSSGNITSIKSTKQYLDTARHVLHGFQRASLLSEDTQLLSFLLIVVSCSQDALTSPSSGGNWRTAESGSTLLGCNSLWEVQTTAFIMIGEVFSRVGTSLPVDEWQLTVKVFRNVMDSLTSRGLLVDGIVMDRFYVSLLQCLHLVFVNAKGSLSNQVAGFIATLRMFFSYGLASKSPLVSTVTGPSKDLTVTSLTSIPAESNKGPYRPPHLRKKNKNNFLINDMQSMSISEYESTTFDHMSSDSDLSDSDGSGKDVSNSLSHKARIAAIVCIQDLCRANPKSFTSQWTMLLPSSDVLQRRRYEATLMTCLLFDPYLKVRIASASTLATMLDGPVSVFLQVAEYKESSKCGSFMALSSSLGQILMQVHTGILHLIKHESHTGLMTSLFKILILLLSATPYPRMPAELLPTIILNLRARIEDGFTLRSDQTCLLAVAINSLTAALYTSPPSVKVKDMFMTELSTGFLEDQGTSGVLSTLFHYSRPIMIPTVSTEALQALKAVAHNYPDIVALCWEQVSSVISGFLCLASPEITTKPWNINAGNAVGAHEKVIMSAIRVLDECLRAISGFKGTEDLSDDKLLDSPFTSDNIKIKTISSAPSYGSESSSASTFQHQKCLSGRDQWREALEKHIPSTLVHSSAMVRAASITCFAGITSAVFFSLPIEKRDSIITYSINAALRDEVPSVRSAACRSIGVIACFPQVFKSAGNLGRFIHAAEFNTRDPLVSVRITASWALANICDSLRHCVNGVTSKDCLIDLKDHSQLTSLLIDCSLRLTGDNDKIKANAVRALGNLSRFVQFSSQSSPDDNREEHGIGFEVIKNGRCMTSNSALPPYSGDPQWLDGMVKAFLSCVTTGNVKVRWNVCHALSNLFLNETLKLQVMDWAPSVFSILLLLLRDSSNYKIRIQAAAALAVPPTVLDYGRSFSDVVQGVANILENLSSDQIAAPTSFKYRVSLEKQLTSTMLHVLGLASGTDHQPVQDFLIKKSSFLEEWLQVLCISLGDVTTQLDAESRNNKKELILKAVQSLVAVYDSRNQHGIATRFDTLGNRML